jgi:Flp pilus assembly protein TadB
MSSYDYSGIDLEAGRQWSSHGLGLFSIGLLFAMIGVGVVVFHALVVLLYGLVLGAGEQT